MIADSSIEAAGTRLTLLRNILERMGLLNPARRIYFVLKRYRQQRVYRQMMRTFLVKHEPQESFEDWERLKEVREAQKYRSCFIQDLVEMVNFIVACADPAKKISPIRIPAEESGKKDEDLLPGIYQCFPGLLNQIPKENVFHDILKFLESEMGGLLQTGPQNQPVLFSTAPAPLRAKLLEHYLDLIFDEEVIPDFFDRDHLDDLEEIIFSRYSCGIEEPGRVNFWKRWLACLLALGELPASFKPAITDLLGVDSRFAQIRQAKVSEAFKKIVPEYAETFKTVRADKDYAVFLDVNRAYSLNQRLETGATDVRELSLFREYEQNYFLLLRTLLGLIRRGKLRARDRVLVVGPRHRNELDFFRRDLGFADVTGLDLFEDLKGGIVAGDMHAMPFADETFKLVYTCNTLCYSHNVRIVVNEIARVIARPGYVFIIDSGTLFEGPSALARTDLKNTETMRRLFSHNSFHVLARDEGRSLAPARYRNQPCLAVELFPGRPHVTHSVTVPELNPAQPMIS